METLSWVMEVQGHKGRGGSRHCHHKVLTEGRQEGPRRGQTDIEDAVLPAWKVDNVTMSHRMPVPTEAGKGEEIHSPLKHPEGT